MNALATVLLLATSAPARANVVASEGTEEREPTHGVRFEFGLGGPNGYGAVRYVARFTDWLTVEPAIGYGASGLSAGAIMAVQLRKPDGLGMSMARRRAGWRIYAGTSVAHAMVEPKDSIDVPEGTYVWLDFGMYFHVRLTLRVQLVAGVNIGALISSPALDGVGEDDDDFDVIGFGKPSWWIKGGVAPGLWAGLQF